MENLGNIDRPVVTNGNMSFEHQSKHGVDHLSRKTQNLMVHSPVFMPLVNYQSKPYVPMAIEELSEVTSLKHWANVKVRVVGRFRLPSSLVSMFEQGGPYSIALDLHLLDVYPQDNTNIQLYGEVELCFATPQIKVFFFRKLDGLDVESYHKAIELQKKYIPHFIKP